MIPLCQFCGKRTLHGARVRMEDYVTSDGTRKRPKDRYRFGCAPCRLQRLVQTQPITVRSA